MKLFEEFQEYENMWEPTEELEEALIKDTTEIFGIFADFVADDRVWRKQRFTTRVTPDDITVMTEGVYFYFSDTSSSSAYNWVTSLLESKKISYTPDQVDVRTFGKKVSPYERLSRVTVVFEF